MYLREANRFLDVRVAKAVLRYAAPKQPQVVYFCQYIAIGATVYTEIHRKLKEKYALMDPMELYVEKVKSINKHNHDFTASLEVEHIIDKDAPPEKLSDKSIKIHDLKIANLPIPYFFGNLKEPYQEFL